VNPLPKAARGYPLTGSPITVPFCFSKTLTIDLVNSADDAVAGDLAEVGAASELA
jgi:hypothetical protein